VFAQLWDVGDIGVC